MKSIKIKSKVGTFAGNKDIAKEIRLETIMPNVDTDVIVLDFEGVQGATQSFIHALISEVIRERGITSLDNIYFKNCNDKVKQIVELVVEYMQQDTDTSK